MSTGKFIFVFFLMNANIAFSCALMDYDNNFEFGEISNSNWHELKVFAPVIENVSLVNGFEECPHNGYVKMQISLPKESEFKIFEVGFYLIPLDPTAENNVNPSYPLKAHKGDDGKYYLQFSWFTRPSKKQKPKDLKFRAVTVLKNGYVSVPSKIYTVAEW